MDRERPNFSGLYDMMSDLRKSLGAINDTHRRMAEVSAVAWSDDRMIKAVVGPRGHLISLEIDPRIYRKPNSTALAATIVATVRQAVEEALAKTQEIVDAAVPVEFRAKKAGDMPMMDFIRAHDADLPKIVEGDHGDVR
ncbi:hypothetical protein Lfu02_14200 [Longispora fulva]|uniref:DNA-binding protein YbaB n=1 Tax=Longispora fulva TaxID=619741 RepID=A0A8J7GVX0_9ACTN|nr:YbaB/EbfC family nucleoid-associated protein [Longispora fulva]MBG6140570.1 DNA-binding protein YbaB [Longispora fulva]GIG57048.1 hypothetical protein Lfu02_14200 [Longispora fulva]